MIQRIKSPNKRPRPDRKLPLNVSLRDARISLGLSQKILGQLVGLTQRDIAGYESCEHIPTYSNARKIANILERNIFDLFPIDRYSEENFDVYDFPKNRISLDQSSRVLPDQSNIGQEESFFSRQEIPLIMNLIRDLLNNTHFENLPNSMRSRSKSFTEEEKYILTNYFGLNGVKEKSLEEIGSDLNLTKSRVGQIKDITLGKLRRHLVFYHQLN